MTLHVKTLFDKLILLTDRSTSLSDKRLVKPATIIMQLMCHFLTGVQMEFH